MLLRGMLSVGFMTVVVLGGCVRGHGGKHPLVLAQDTPKIKEVHLVHGVGAGSDGLLIHANYDPGTSQSGPDFKALFGGTQVSLVPAQHSSGLSLNEGWAFVTGNFRFTPPRSMAAWGFWPIIIRSSSAIGADGTELIVDATKQNEVWVHCRKGGPAWVWRAGTPGTSTNSFKVVEGWSAHFVVTASTLVKDQEKVTDMNDPVYSAAVSAAVASGIAQ